MPTALRGHAAVPGNMPTQSAGHGTRQLLLACCLSVAVLILGPADAQADGGSLIFSKVHEGYRVTLFTAPTPLRAGRADFSVLLQSLDSETPVLDVPLTISAYPKGAPERRTRGLATTAAATNKLFRAATLELSQPGRWYVEVVVSGTAKPMEATVMVAEPPPRWLELGWWLGWPAAVIVLFAIHEALVARQQARVSGEPPG